MSRHDIYPQFPQFPLGTPGNMTPFSVHTREKKRKERNTCIFRVSLLHVKQAQLINLVTYLKAMYLTSQNDWKTENLSAKLMVIVAAHSPLTGRYFES